MTESFMNKLDYQSTIIDEKIKYLRNEVVEKIEEKSMASPRRFVS
jgi:hypothetical protein